MEFSYSIACAAAEPEDSASDAAVPIDTSEAQDAIKVSKATPVFKPPPPRQDPLPCPPSSTHTKHNRDASTPKQHKEVSYTKHRETSSRMVYDPENKHMQPRVELQEYAARIGLTAVKNGSSHYDFREEKADRLEEDRVEFAKKRDREWAAQKQLDERHHTKDDTNTHRKRKKAKHSKSDDNQYKRRKLHAQITSPESPEDALKMKVKLTPTIASKHKHKYHIEPITVSSPLEKPSTTTSNAITEKKELSTKEKLLQMRAVRKDKAVANVVQSPKVEQATQPIVTTASSTPLLDKGPSQLVQEKNPMVKLPPLKLPTDKPAAVKSTAVKLSPIKFAATKPPPVKTLPSKSSTPPLKIFSIKSPSPPKLVSIKSVSPKPAEVKTTNEIISKKRASPPTDNKSEPPVIKPKIDPESANFVPKEATPTKPTNTVTTITDKLREMAQSKPNSETSSREKPKAEPPKTEMVKQDVKIIISTSTTSNLNTIKPLVGTSSPKVIRPPPATIPLVRIKKSISKTVTFSSTDKTFTSNAKIPTTSLKKTPEPNNPMCDNIGALDLSGKSSRSPTSDTRPTNSPSPPTANKILNGITKHKKTENPMSNLQMLSESAVQILSQSKTTVSRMPIKQQPMHNLPVRPSIPHGLRIPQLTTTTQITHKPVNTILKFNEIKGMRNVNPRPQNQSIRSIPNPSALNFRPAQIKPPIQDEPKKAPVIDAVTTTACSTLSDIKKNENIAKNLNLEKVTAELAGRASEANKLVTKSTTQMMTP